MNKDAMTIQVSYTPSGSQINSKLDNLLSLENSKAESHVKRFNIRKSSKSNIVKSILNKRKRKADPGKEFIINGEGDMKTYGNMHRMNNEGLVGFQEIGQKQSRKFQRNDPYLQEYSKPKESKIN
jgi:hypothetical protein